MRFLGYTVGDDPARQTELGPDPDLPNFRRGDLMNPVGRPRAHRVGLGLAAFTAALLVVDGVSHVVNPAFVATTMTELGFAHSAAPVIGIIELCCVALYAFRRTAPLGAVLLTGYLGGAVAANLRVDKPLLSTVLFPIYVSLVLWVGVVLRRDDVRSVVASIVKADNSGAEMSASSTRMEQTA